MINLEPVQRQQRRAQLESEMLAALEEALGDRDKQIIQVIYFQKIFFLSFIYPEKDTKFEKK